MTVRQLIAALEKAENKNAQVDVIDERGDSIADAGHFLVDEDSESVHIVVLNN